MHFKIISTDHQTDCACPVPTPNNCELITQVPAKFGFFLQRSYNGKYDHKQLNAVSLMLDGINQGVLVTFFHLVTLVAVGLKW